MKYVTFYHDLMRGTSDIVIHSDKETAKTYYLNHYESYFTLMGSKIPKDFAPPYSYGYSHRRYYIMTQRKFENIFGKKVGEM